MKYLKSLSLAALAALAVLAVIGASAASASHPKFEPTGTAFPIPFTGHGLHGVLEGTDTHQTTCKSSTVSGNITSAITAQNIVVKFHGCTAFFGFVACNTAGQPSGTVVTTPLDATLVYLETGTNKKGLLLQPENKEEHFATLECGGTSIKVIGTVLAELTEVNEKEYVIHFRKLSNHHPSPALYLNPSTCGHLITTESLHATGTGGFTPFATTPAGLEGTGTLTLTKEVKITGNGCV